ncbi:MAG TPA: PBP1A family penicillin-binding protein [Thermoanaerobaculia bacterium]|nr:PBP1A family penicillin-binding protein [Thermoanaerobaculia bacterium]
MMRETYNSFRRDLAGMPPARRRVVIGVLTTFGLVLVLGLAGAVYLWDLARRFPQAPFKQPSRLYGEATRLAPGAGIGIDDIVAELESQGYREAEEESEKGEADEAEGKDEGESAAEGGEGDAGRPLPPGTFRRQEDRLAVDLRSSPTTEGPAPGGLLEVTFRGRRIGEIRQAGRVVDEAALPPPLLASYYDDEVQERRPVTLDQVPEHVIQAILAAEDDGFYTHPGVSPTGVARALWVNLRGEGEVQGGSTITQQLVKNVYLSSERTLSRKAKEALIAMMLEIRHGKKAILEAYLNEIYWGASSSVNLIGLGAASYAYYGKEPRELTLSEAATLAGMIQAPANYLPTQHPEEARERRDWVLQRMDELDWITPEQRQRAAATPVVARPQKLVTRPLAPYFAEFAKQEATERFDIEDIGGEGYLLFSSLRWRDQKEAQRALERGLASLDPRGGKNGKDPLQGALVSVDPRDGAILAYVGGRDYADSQFDRVSTARRQAGSAFKPVVYAAAFAESVATPVTLLRDSPITVKVDNKPWRPQNYDRGFQGSVTARTALERSLNIPTIRLALQVGLHRVVDLSRDMGIEGEMDTVPALALGTFEVSPRELAEVYSVFANDGLRPRVHGLKLVLDREGQEVDGEELESPQRVLSPQVAYLVTSGLQGVLDRGTAAAARGWGVQGRLAGKTGTTNDRRDNWFAGYSPDRVTVVWVGYDDNRRTRFSGSTAALPVWSRFTMAVRPAGGYKDFARPQGIVQLAIDPTTGQLATDACPYVVTDVFPDWKVPTEPCHRHGHPSGGRIYADAGGYYDPYATDPDPYGQYSEEDPYAGEPVDPYLLDTYIDQEGPRPVITNQPAALPPRTVRVNPLEPVGVDPAEIDTEAEEGVAVGEGEEDGSYIRPSSQRPAPPEPPLAGTAQPAPPEAAAADTPASEGEDETEIDVSVGTVEPSPTATPPAPPPAPPVGTPVGL